MNRRMLPSASPVLAVTSSGRTKSPNWTVSYLAREGGVADAAIDLVTLLSAGAQALAGSLEATPGAGAELLLSDMRAGTTWC